MPQRRLQWSSVAWVLLGMALLLMFGCSGGGSQAQETPAGDAAPATGTSPQEPPSTDPGTTPAPQNPTTPPGSMEPPAPTPPLLSDTPVAAPLVVSQPPPPQPPPPPPPPPALTAPPAPAAYTIVDLGSTLAMHLDNTSTVVGSTFTPEQQAAVLAPTVQALTTTGGRADAIRGQAIVGYASFLLETTPTLTRAATHGFLWTSTEGMVDLGTTGAPTLFSAATGLQDPTLIVGYADDPTAQVSKPCLWAHRKIQVLPTLGGTPGTQGFADAINPTGLIVGQSQVASGELHATLWVMGLPQDLTGGGATYSLARSFNRTPVVVGNAVFPSPSGFHAFRWTAATGMQDLGTLPDHVTSDAFGINEAGVIVGTSTGVGPLPPPQKAVRWTVERGIEDLNALVTAPGWTLEEARAINDQGVIVGQGWLNGQRRAWMLVPPPTSTRVAAR